MIEVQKQLAEYVRKALKNVGISNISIETVLSMDHPKELAHGDYSTNVALIYAKPLTMKPRELAEKIVAELERDTELSKKNIVEKIDIAGPGFINFHLKPEFFRKEILGIVANRDEKNKCGSSDSFAKAGFRKVMVEYTQPNPFKEFHIGHLMNNVVGESLSRVIEYSGAEVKRATYHGDVGLHVAKTIWAMQKSEAKDKGKGNSAEMIVMSAKNVTVVMLGTWYVAGSTAYEDDESARTEITLINKKIYDKSDAEINRLYDIGRWVSFEHFETLYKRLGSVFDFHFYESESAVLGRKIVLDFLEKGVFEKSDGAVIFRGEKYGLHTRVFLNKEGIPTYEAKEVGLAQIKRKVFPADLFITVTANEQDSFFKVVEKAIGEIFKDEKDGKNEKDEKGTMTHVSHGLLGLTSSGKMSSRKGNIISAESFINDVKALVMQRIADRDIPKDEKDAIAETVAISAIKYTILRQSVGADVIFDPTAAISFEGDSGPYLQYSTVRAKSIREKAAGEGIAAHVDAKEAAKMAAKNEKSAAKSENKNPAAFPAEISTLEKLLYRFPEIVERSAEEYEPHYLTTYLVELAAAFNNYYAKNQIVLKSDPASPYKVALTHAFEIVMRNGLHLLGIGVPERM